MVQTLVATIRTDAARKIVGQSEYSSYKARSWRGRCQLESASSRTRNEKRTVSLGHSIEHGTDAALAASRRVRHFRGRSSGQGEDGRDTLYRRPKILSEPERPGPRRLVASRVRQVLSLLRQRGVRVQVLAGAALRRRQADLRLQGERGQLRRHFSFAETQPPRPLLQNGDCEEKHFACGDGTCFPAAYFCDGSVDCPDGSDEGWCDVRNDPNGASTCDPKNCHLPDCWCSEDGTQVPGNLTASTIPQMITITFDDAVDANNFGLYSMIFSADRKNPNGCPVRGTFYISHQYTDYREVQYLWNVGHEIAAHSVTHRGPEDWWSKNATIEDWFDEMVGVANIINKYAAVRLKDIRGLRAPFLRVGWNRQFLMMSEFGFLYDSSMVAPFSDPPFWPYTLDHRPPHDCVGAEQLCPTRAYPGLWELPLNQLLAGGYNCTRLDTCSAELSGEDVYKILMLNFKRHYLSNRAPLGLHLHSSWFRNRVYFDALTKFVDDVLKLKDVYFVTSHQVIEWMRTPTPLSEIERFAPWQCGARQLQPFEIACDSPNSCKLPSRVLKSHRYLYTCFECPKEYPWLRNEFGLE